MSPKLAALGGAVSAWVVNDMIGGGTFKLLLLGVGAAVVTAVVNRDEKQTTT